MITKETCVKIYHCHNQIEECDKLMAEMAKIVADDKEKKSPQFYEAFGERSGLQMGVPSGGGHRIFNVNVDMGVRVIEQHKKDMQERLIELMAIAKIELSV